MMSSDDDMVYDVVIIGGGASGATAAYRLHKVLANKNEGTGKEHKILLIEAKERLGGRTLTIPVNSKDGKEMYDLGGQWIGRTQHHLLWLMKELGIEYYKQYTTGTKFLHMKDGKLRPYTSTPRISIFNMLDFGNLTMKLDRMVKTIPIDDPTKCQQAEEWDGMTVETFLKKSMWTSGTREMVESLLRLILGTTTKECSLLYFLSSLASVGGIDVELESGEGSAQEFCIKGGAQQISEMAANIIGSDNIWLNEPVTLIDQSNSEYIRLETESRKEVKTKYIIVSAPVNCIERIKFKPDLPADRHFLAQRMPLGHLVKCVVTYKKAFWRDGGFSGEVLNIGDTTVNGRPIQAFIDSGKAENTSPALVGFFGNSREWRKIEVSVRRREVIKQLVEYFGPDANDVIDYVDKDWAEEPYNGGCPGNIMTTGAMTLFYDCLRKPVDRVHWAGTETATLWYGYITGAVQSGLRAADEILTRIDPSLPQDGLLKSLNNQNLKYSKGSPE